ncbi:MAG: AAA family ATPase [Planctomycetaceae bacterium]
MPYFRQTVWYKLALCAAVAAVAVAAILLASKSEYMPAAIVAGVIGLLFLVVHLVGQISERIDARLARELHLSSLKGLHVYTKSFPGYRFVDVYRAVERFADAHGNVTVVDTQHAEDLNSIVNSQFYGEQSGKVHPPSQVPRDVAYDTEEFFPTDRFWVIPGRKHGFPARNRESSENVGRENDDGPLLNSRASSPSGVAVLRVRIMDYTGEVALEMATVDASDAEDAVERIIEDDIANSIYRNQLLQISFDSGVKDEYGEIDNSSPFNLLFIRRKNITREKIILDDETSRILERNVFEFHRNRDALQKHGIPTKKGILFYGPPGTGKTYTCQYIYSTLENVTTLVVTGQSLLHVKTICNLARMLQPALLVLEDVDLIFASREINLYSTALGDLMDELDGFQTDEPVMFLLTTNAIDRLEQAIKDRPGRISQCVYFGPPNATLRKLYIQRYLDGYEAKQLDLDAVVTETRGTSQAFLKELIYRAVQIALEDPGHNGDTVTLRNPDFTTAMKEMTRFDAKATGSIMGFRVEE